MLRLEVQIGHPLSVVPKLWQWLTPLLILIACAPVFADITIKFDNQKDGDKISDVAPIIVRADSADNIDKVEFAVDDQLRLSTGSSPYTYKWDTIADSEGAHALSVTAIDANGVKKTVKITLTIDNELSLGAPALAAKAREALSAGDTDTANRFSRRALKADPDNADAARALAAIHAQHQSWDKAIDVLAKSKNLSSSVNGMLELASYRMRRAVLPENAANLVSDIEGAGDLRRKAADLAIDNLKAKNLPAGDARTHEVLGDALVSAGRYREAVLEYSKSGGGAELTTVNRTALAYVLNDQAPEAITVLRPLIKDKTGDAASRAVFGLALLRSRHFSEAREIVRTDLTASNPASLLVASYADAALGKTAAALQEAKDAAESRPAAGESHYALSLSLPRLVDSEAELIKALAISPFQTGPMVDYAVRIALSTDHPDRFETALKLLHIVLKIEPDNRSAQIATALLLLHLKRITDAEPILSELSKRDAQGADVQIVVAIYFDIKGNPTAVGERMKQAAKLDPDFFATELGVVPKPLEFLYSSVRKSHYRGGFYIMPETIYPPKTAVTARL